ncbi:hypothetical protein [Egbenema bharatensis]|uniref:hypothetical protein n=1 Tax=Egbenema bharatensis TaxID=3463334 RepID=UPI003A89D575
MLMKYLAIAVFGFLLFCLGAYGIDELIASRFKQPEDEPQPEAESQAEAENQKAGGSADAIITALEGVVDEVTGKGLFGLIGRLLESAGEFLSHLFHGL